MVSFSSEGNTNSNSKVADKCYLISGFAPVATTVAMPLMVLWSLRNSHKAPMVKYNQIVNEVVRQYVGGTIGLVSYFGGGELTRLLFKAIKGTGSSSNNPNKKDSPADKQEADSKQKVDMLLGGNAMNFLGFAIVRPWFTTGLVCKFLKEEGEEATLSKAHMLEISKLPSESERTALMDKKLKEAIQEKLSAGKDGSFLTRKLQHWVDHNFFEKKPHELAKPLLRKSAIVSTVALTAWLSGLGAIFYGINRAFDRSAKKKDEADSKPNNSNVVVNPAPPMILMKPSTRFSSHLRAPSSLSL